MSLSDIIDSSTGGATWKNFYINNLNTAGNIDVSGNINCSGSINGGSINASLVPATDNNYNLGSGANRWRNLYLGSDADISGNCDVIGDITCKNLNVGFDADVSGNINVDGVINSTAGQCIQATGIIYTNSVVGAGQNINAPFYNLQATTNQMIFTHGSGNPTIINCPNPSASRFYNINDVGSNANFILNKSSPLLTELPNWQFVRSLVTCGTGVNNIYTVPAGFRAVANTISAYNNSGGVIQANVGVTISGTNYRTTGNTALPLLARTIVVNSGLYIYEENEIITLNLASGSGIDTATGIILYSNTYPLYVIKLIPSLTPTVLFTATNNTRGAQNPSIVQWSTTTVRYVNDTATTQSLTIQFTPNGSTIRTISSSSTNTLSLTSVDFGCNFLIGDVVTVTSTSALTTQLVYMLVCEV